MPRIRLEVGESTTPTVRPMRQLGGKWEVVPEVERSRGAKYGRHLAMCSVRLTEDRTVRLKRSGATVTEARNALASAVADALAEVQRDREDDLERAASARGRITAKWTVAQVVQRYLHDLTDVAESTQQTYRHVAHRHVIGHDGRAVPALADWAIVDVTSVDLRDALLTIGATAGVGVMRTARTIYRGTFALAKAHLGSALTNPVRDIGDLTTGAVERRRRDLGLDGVRKTKAGTPARRTRDPRRALSDGERRSLLAFLAEDEHAQRFDLEDLVAVLLGAGVRIGEALALHWDDVDFTAGDIAVGEWTVQRVTGKGLARRRHGATKASPRRIALSDDLLARLKARQERLARERGETLRVFPAVSAENYRDPDNLNKVLRVALDSAGLDWATSHTMRKTAITRLHAAGATDRTVANFSGHRQIKVMQDHYLDRTERADARLLTEA